MSSSKTRAPDPESIERLQKEVGRLKNLLTLANLGIAHLEKETLPLLSRVALGGKRVPRKAVIFTARAISVARGTAPAAASLRSP